MNNIYSKLSRSDARNLRLNAAIHALEREGYELKRLPGRGQSSVYLASKGGAEERISIRTTKGRRFAFPSTNNGEEWLTLDDVDSVVVSAADNPKNPRKVQVYKFDAKEVRKRFTAAYKARQKADMSIRDNFGMWVALDRDKRNIPRSVGTGLGDDFPPIAEYTINECIKDLMDNSESRDSASESVRNEPSSISEVVEWARGKIAALAGVQKEAVKLDLKIEY